MEQAISDTVTVFCPEVQAISLFGSYGTGEEWPDSGAELALLLPPRIAKNAGVGNLLACQQALAGRLRKDIDLIHLRMGSTIVQKEVVDTGRRIMGKSEEEVLAFEMPVLIDYVKSNEERKEILRSFRETKRADTL